MHDQAMVSSLAFFWLRAAAAARVICLLAAGCNAAVS
jgi:hypothetical protein